jgi:hypothetical protein
LFAARLRVRHGQQVGDQATSGPARPVTLSLYQYRAAGVGSSSEIELEARHPQRPNAVFRNPVLITDEPLTDAG